MRRRLLVGSVAIAAFAALATMSSPALAGPPNGFFGVDFEFYPDLPHKQIRMLQEARVKDLRFTLTWRAAEPTNGDFDWARWDKLIGDLAAAGIRSEPTLYGSPVWATGRTVLGIPVDGQTQATAPVELAHAPNAEGYWREFVAAAVQRYGHGGTYWSGPYRREHPGSRPLPVQVWEVWNEPNLQLFFQPQPSPARYAILLSLAHDAIKANDSRAKVALAGMPTRVDFPAWSFLRQLYLVSGFRQDFDIASLHPYGHSLASIAHDIAHFRQTLRDEHASSMPLWLSEFSWSSGPANGGISRGLQGQAKALRRTMKLFTKNRRKWHLRRATWFTWRDPTPGPSHSCIWCQNAGLLDASAHPKPAWRAFRNFQLGRR